ALPADRRSYVDVAADSEHSIIRAVRRHGFQVVVFEPDVRALRNRHMVVCTDAVGDAAFLYDATDGDAHCSCSIDEPQGDQTQFLIRHRTLLAAAHGPFLNLTPG